MLGRIITIGLVVFLILGAALMFLGPWMKRDAAPEKLPACPYLQNEEFASVPPEVIAARLMPEGEGEALEGVTKAIRTMLHDRLPIWRRFGII